MEVILAQLAAQPAHFDANHGIDFAVVIGGAIENFDADDGFFQTVFMPGQNRLYQEAKEPSNLE